MPSNTDNYNGWTNYETWAVKLWLDNDQGYYNAMQELAREALEDCDNDADRQQARYPLAQAVEAFVGELPECVAVTETASFVADLFGRSLGRVNWTEIAENMLTEAIENA